MGFVPTVLIHPSNPQIVVARTDVGGVFRFDRSRAKWLSLTDAIDGNADNVESLALSASQPQKICFTSGNHVKTPEGADGSLWCSGNLGETWTQTELRIAGQRVRVGGNSQWRDAGERLAIDPLNASILFLGTRYDGLLKSTNGGTTWERVADVPAGDVPTGSPAAPGVTWVVFAPGQNSSGQTATQTLYAGVSQKGIYVSRNGGATWAFVSGVSTAVVPMRAALAADGSLFTTFSRLDGTLPAGTAGLARIVDGVATSLGATDGKGLSGIATHPENAQMVLVSKAVDDALGLRLSRDGGATWNVLQRAAEAPAWYPSWMEYGSAGYQGSLIFDPLDSGSAWSSNGFGVFRLVNVASASPVPWRTVMDGLEELVVNHVLLPRTEVDLMVGTWDMIGFALRDSTHPPSEKLLPDGFGIITSLAQAPSSPQEMAWAGSDQQTWSDYASGAGRKARGGISHDGGKTWSALALPPQSGAFFDGKLAFSATDSKLLLWFVQRYLYSWSPGPHFMEGAGFLSTDGGTTWNPVQGLPPSLPSLNYAAGRPLTADAVKGSAFYYLHCDPANSWSGEAFASSDGGATFARVATGLPCVNGVTLLSVPGREAHLVYASFETPSIGLRISADGAKTWRKSTSFDKASHVAIASGNGGGALFVMGQKGAEKGLFCAADGVEKLASGIEPAWQQVPNVLPVMQRALLQFEVDAPGRRALLATSGRGVFELSIPPSLCGF